MHACNQIRPTIGRGAPVYEYGVWAFLLLAGILALTLIVYLGYMLVNDRADARTANPIAG